MALAETTMPLGMSVPRVADAAALALGEAAVPALPRAQADGSISAERTNPSAAERRTR